MDSAGEVVLTVVVSSMVVARGEVTRVVVVTFTLVGAVCGWSLAGAPVVVSGRQIRQKKKHKKPQSSQMPILSDPSSKKDCPEPHQLNKTRSQESKVATLSLSNA